MDSIFIFCFNTLQKKPIFNNHLKHIFEKSHRVVHQPITKAAL